MKYTGKVFKVYERAFKGNTLYSIKLEDQPLYHRMDKKRFAGIAEPGNFVTFEAEPNADGASAKVIGDVTLAQPAPAAQSAPAAAYGGATSSREGSIHYQSSRKDAIEFVKLVIQANGVKLPAKQAGILEAIEAFVDAKTAQFFEDIGTFGAVSRANGTDTPAEEEAEPGEEE